MQISLHAPWYTIAGIGVALVLAVWGLWRTHTDRDDDGS